LQGICAYVIYVPPPIWVKFICRVILSLGDMTKLPTDVEIYVPSPILLTLKLKFTAPSLFAKIIVEGWLPAVAKTTVAPAPLVFTFVENDVSGVFTPT